MRKGIHFVHYKLIKHQRSTKEPQLECVILESVQRDRSPKNDNPQSCDHLLASHVTSNLYNFLSSLEHYFGIFWRTVLFFSSKSVGTKTKSQWITEQSYIGPYSI